MRIGDVAKQLRVSTDWLRRLERRGDLPKAHRDRNGHRRYTPQQVEVIRASLFPSHS